MSPTTRSFSALIALAVSVSTFSQSVSAQSTFPPTALADKHFAYPTGIPYMVDTDQGLIRGFQHGYNQCNSTTENQQSLCQTSFVNAADDFCLWAPDHPDSVVANTEGEMVAWCTKPGRGTRLIPAGALQGIQFMKTPDYVQVIGFIDQTKINIQAGDYGGEMDPHGADLRGNPMGGLMYSNAFSGGGNNFQQVIEWHNFMGGNAFCIKACDPAGPNAAHFCEHRLDRIGCAYNAPNNAQNGTFESCKGDNQDFPGVYTTNGAVVTYTQPPEEQGAISTMPYQPKVPASSECQPFTSSVLFSALGQVTGSASASTAAPTGTGKPTSGKPATSGSKTGAPGAANTSNDAQTVVASGIVTLVGVVFSAMFFS
ncbi:manno protein [Lyophyllum atratum]|nr:manno protein [Lyophyllum atratum]